LQHLAVADKVEANTEPLRAPARQLPITWLAITGVDTTAENLLHPYGETERRRAKGWGAYRNALLASGTCREPTLQLLLASTATGNEPGFSYADVGATADRNWRLLLQRPGVDDKI
jgi:hypothetical protein